MEKNSQNRVSCVYTAVLETNGSKLCFIH